MHNVTKKRLLTSATAYFHCSRSNLGTLPTNDTTMTTNTINTTASFESIWYRLGQLELWYELGIRPNPCPPEDLDLWTCGGGGDDDDYNGAIDNLPLLRERCQSVRWRLNHEFVPNHIRDDRDLHPEYEACLKVLPSTIPGAGLGLFNMSRQVLPAGVILCYYAGHLHTMQSSRSLTDTRYLMLVHGNVLVDAGPLVDVKSRYINDPLNDDFVNSKFVPPTSDDAFGSKGRHHQCVAVMSTRPILPGQELFASYGPAYWSQQEHPGHVKC